MTKSTGKVFRYPRHWTLAQRLDYRIDKSGGPDACWRWDGYRDRDGYGRIWWRSRPQGAHCMVWELENGPIPAGLFACHKCDVPYCCNPAHMFLGTTVDNTADRDAKGRGHSLKGEAIGSAKLTEADVRAIRAAVGPQRAIATQFNVSQAAVSNIRIGKAWAHLL